MASVPGVALCRSLPNHRPVSIPPRAFPSLCKLPKLHGGTRSKLGENRWLKWRNKRSRGPCLLSALSLPQPSFTSYKQCWSFLRTYIQSLVLWWNIRILGFHSVHQSPWPCTIFPNFYMFVSFLWEKLTLNMVFSELYSLKYFQHIWIMISVIFQVFSPSNCPFPSFFSFGIRFRVTSKYPTSIHNRQFVRWQLFVSQEYEYYS